MGGRKIGLGRECMGGGKIGLGRECMGGGKIGLEREVNMESEKQREGEGGKGSLRRNGEGSECKNEEGK